MGMYDKICTYWKDYLKEEIDDFVEHHKEGIFKNNYDDVQPIVYTSCNFNEKNQLYFNYEIFKITHGTRNYDHILDENFDKKEVIDRLTNYGMDSDNINDITDYLKEAIVKMSRTEEGITCSEPVSVNSDLGFGVSHTFTIKLAN